MTVFARAILFLSAFTPAFLLLAWRALPTNPALSAGLLTGAGLVLVLTFRLIIELRRGTPLRAEVTLAESRSGDIAGSLLAYVLPFTVADYSDTSSVVTLAAVFVLLGVVSVRGHLTHLNPILLVFGMNVWHLRVVYRAEGATGEAASPQHAARSAVVISDDLDVAEGSVLWIMKADGPIWFAAKDDPHA